MNPLVTVGMPVFNGLPLFMKSMNSIRSQTYRNIEIVVSDNASVDGTTESIGDFARADSRIRVFRQTQTISALANYRFVLNEGRGEYFFWAPHDDFWDPRFVEVGVKALEASRDAIAACGTSHSVNDAGTVLATHREPYGLDIAERCARIKSYVHRNVPDLLYYAFFRRRALLDTIWSFSIAPEKVVLMHVLLQGRVLDCPDMHYYNRHVPKTRQDVVDVFGLPGYNARYEAQVFLDVVRELYRGTSMADFARLLPHVIVGQRWHRFFARKVLEKLGLLREKR